MKIRSTTILTVRHKGTVAIGGDGQVTLGNTVMKADAVKIRRAGRQRVITGFAGASADAFALLERFEAKLKDFPSNVPRAATELAKEWRTDRVLRRLEALLAVVDASNTLLDQRHRRRDPADRRRPGHRLRRQLRRGRGPGARRPFDAFGRARSSARSLEIAAGIDIYTNTNIVVEELPCET